MRCSIQTESLHCPCRKSSISKPLALLKRLGKADPVPNNLIPDKAGVSKRYEKLRNIISKNQKVWRPTDLPATFIGHGQLLLLQQLQLMLPPLSETSPVVWSAHCPNKAAAATCDNQLACSAVHNWLLPSS